MVAVRAYDHVVFDLDGTLADTRDDLAASVNHALLTLHLPVLPTETICGYVGEGARLLVERALGGEHRDRLDEALALFLRHYEAHLLDRTVAYAGVADVLSELHGRGVILSVLTNKPERMSRAILDGLGILPRFKAVVGGDSLPGRKPDPCGIDHLQELTGTPRERALLVGDSTVDLKTAHAAGIAFCGVAWGIRPRDLLDAAGPPRLIRHARELLDVVESGI